MNQRIVLLLCACVLSLTACGHKGKLKTPSQIELEEQKKQAKAEKKAREEAKKKEEQSDEASQDTEQ